VLKTCRRIIIWVKIEHGKAEFTRRVKCVLWTLQALAEEYFEQKLKDTSKLEEQISFLIHTLI